MRKRASPRGKTRSLTKKSIPRRRAILFRKVKALPSSFVILSAADKGGPAHSPLFPGRFFPGKKIGEKHHQVCPKRPDKRCASLVRSTLRGGIACRAQRCPSTEKKRRARQWAPPYGKGPGPPMHTMPKTPPIDTTKKYWIICHRQQHNRSSRLVPATDFAAIRGRRPKRGPMAL
ncbi:MAG: hypothetical protein CM15mP68_0220 [Pseudomonadota bacterium]|nr:MAG: hypothetical protein CM15mP68_0220 [Pseudomonadota bacterium]